MFEQGNLFKGSSFNTLDHLKIYYTLNKLFMPPQLITKRFKGFLMKQKWPFYGSSPGGPAQCGVFPAQTYMTLLIARLEE